MTPTDPTERFSDRVASYVTARPGYPSAVVAILESWGALRPDSLIADVGCGTGIFARLLLEHGYRVIGVEPNTPMRDAARDIHRDHPDFHIVDGRAEATTLDDSSVDLVVAAQAFHWFDMDATRREFGRILRPDGHVALVWNARRTDATAFLGEFERLLVRFGTDYERVNHRGVGVPVLDAFFTEGYDHAATPNEQALDWEGLRQRVLSASYMPPPGHRDHDAMMVALRSLFDCHAEFGRVSLLYDTLVYCGTPHPAA